MAQVCACQVWGPEFKPQSHKNISK
jgi:hypothetical protein